MEKNAKFSKVFEERLLSFLADHYCKRVDTRLPDLWFVRLKHMSNGNTIVLRGYPRDGTITQLTNGVVTHHEHIA